MSIISSSASIKTKIQLILFNVPDEFKIRMILIFFLNNFATIAQRRCADKCVEANDVVRSCVRSLNLSLRIACVPIQAQTQKFVINPNTWMRNNVIIKHICNFASLHLINLVVAASCGIQLWIQIIKVKQRRLVAFAVRS